MKTVPHNIHDAGRSESSFKGERNDCAVRALAVALGITYNEAYARCESIGRKKGGGVKFKVFAQNLDALGLEMRPDLSCMTLAKALPEMQSGKFLCRVFRHFFAVVDGKVIDTWLQKPGRRLKMVYQKKGANE